MLCEHCAVNPATYYLVAHHLGPTMFDPFMYQPGNATVYVVRTKICDECFADVKLLLKNNDYIINESLSYCISEQQNEDPFE